MTESNLNIDGISTYLALPLDSTTENFIPVSDQFQIVKNFIFKTLNDGTLCLISSNDNEDLSTQTQLPQELPQEIQQPQEMLDSSLFFTNLDPVEEPEEAPVVERPNVIVEEPPPPSKVEKAIKPLYKCPKCKEVFVKVALYRKHMSWHRNNKKYKCDQCPVSYNVESNLKIHKATHAEGKPQCPMCNLSFQRLASLKSHLMLHQVEEFYNCEECSEEFEKEEDLDRHLHTHYIHIQEDNLTCTYCKVKFDDAKDYKEHVSHHIKMKKMVYSGKRNRRSHCYKELRHICAVCQKSFSKSSLLERHLRVHSGERPYVCPICKKGFNQKGTLQIHLNKHKGIKPFHCTLCSAKFNQKGNLRVHVEKTHTAPQPGVKTYKCAHCTCIFKKVASLNVHITKTHATDEVTGTLETAMDNSKELASKTDKENVGKFKSKVPDGTSFVRLAESFLDGTVRRYLVKQRKVNDIRYYICNECSKEFKKPSDLIRHTRVHTKEKPFSCKQCGASFSLKSTLHCHLKTHVRSPLKNQMGNICMVCKKKFSNFKSFITHMRTHVELQDLHYKCSTCNWSCMSLKEATNHQLGHSQNQHFIHSLKHPLLDQTQIKDEYSAVKNYSCTMCGKIFPSPLRLKKHVTIAHEPHHPETAEKPIETLNNQSDPPLNITDMVFPSCEDLNLPTDTNTLYPQLKLQNNDPLFLASIADLQDSGVFNIDPSVLDVTSADILNTNQIFNIVNTAPPVAVNELKTPPKDKLEIAASSAPYSISNSDISLLLNLDSDFGEESPPISLGDINLNDINIQGEPEGGDGKELSNVDNVSVSKSHPRTKTTKNINESLLSDHVCTFCGKDFRKMSDLVRHIRCHTGERPFACDKCDRKFSLKSTLQSHQKTHNPISHKSYRCVVCNSFFTSKSSLRVHVLLHTGGKPHQCNFCEAKFRTVSAKKSHESAQHFKNCTKPSNNKQLKNLLETVAVAGFTGHHQEDQNLLFDNPTQEPQIDSINNHRNLENVLVIQEPFQIVGANLEDNPVGSSTMYQQPEDTSGLLLQDHLIPTSLIQLDDGTLLNIKTLSADDLRPDLLYPASSAETPPMVPKEKPRNLECEVCHKLYASKDVLRKHKRTHGVYRQFPCSKCDKGFDTGQELQLHEQVHAGLRPFGCTFCTNSFARKHSLTTHLKRMHKNQFSQD